MKQLLPAFLLLSFYSIHAQNAGIGTMHPNMAFHIAKSDSNLLLLENLNFLNAGTANAIFFKTGGYFTGAVKSIGEASGTARLGFFTYTDSDSTKLVERMSILDAGNVGIGTTLPQSALSIKQPRTSLLDIENSTPYASSVSSNLQMKIAGVQTGSLRSIVNSNGSDTRLGMFVGHTIYLADQSEMVSVLQQGVGLRTTNPGATLHVKSPNNGSASAIIENEGAAGSALEFRNNGLPSSWDIVGYNSSIDYSSSLEFHYETINANSTYMVIDGNGNVGIGALSPAAPLHIYSNSSVGTPQLLLTEAENDYARIKMKSTNPGGWDIASISSATNTSAYFNLYFDNGTTAGNKFVLNGNGNLWIAGTLTQNSDERLKKNISTLDNSLQKIEEIGGYHYNWKDADRDQNLQTGVLAQELEKVMPELVSQDEQGIKSVNYIGLVPYLVEAIKTLEKEVEELKTKK